MSEQKRQAADRLLCQARAELFSLVQLADSFSFPRCPNPSEICNERISRRHPYPPPPRGASFASCRGEAAAASRRAASRPSLPAGRLTQAMTAARVRPPAAARSSWCHHPRPRRHRCPQQERHRRRPSPPRHLNPRSRPRSAAFPRCGLTIGPVPMLSLPPRLRSHSAS